MKESSKILRTSFSSGHPNKETSDVLVYLGPTVDELCGYLMKSQICFARVVSDIIGGTLHAPIY
jgi:hypothetical protein